jgi:hypothetical protein
LAAVLSAAFSCCFIALGCSSESHGPLRCDSGSVSAPSSGGATLDDCKAALDALIEEGKFAVKLDAQNHGDHGVMCLADESGKLTLRILNNDPKAAHESLGKVKVALRNKGSVLVPYFRDLAEIPGDSPKEGEAIAAGAVLAAAQPAVAPVFCGSSARGAGMSELGTVGWNVVFEGQAVCITNHHVLSDGATPALNHDVILDGRTVAKLYRYHALQFSSGNQTPVNYWDIALASYNSNSAAIAGNLACATTHIPFTYPYLMAPSGTVQPFQSFHFVGLASGCVSHFVLQGIGHGTVKLFGKNAYFECQLLFPLQTAPRDSGSLIIRDDQYAVGLHMYEVKDSSTNILYSMANPIYRIPWKTNPPAQPAGAPALLPAFSSAAPVAAPDCINGPPLPQ